MDIAHHAAKFFGEYSADDDWAVSGNLNGAFLKSMVVERLSKSLLPTEVAALEVAALGSDVAELEQDIRRAIADDPMFGESLRAMLIREPELAAEVSHAQLIDRTLLKQDEFKPWSPFTLALLVFGAFGLLVVVLTALAVAF